MRSTPPKPVLQIQPHRHLSSAIAFAVLTLVTIGILSAEPPRGRLLASQCFQCHGTNGQAVGGFESISGESANEMFEELREMSQRRPEGIMDLQARAFTDNQLRLIAEYLETLPPGSDDDDDEDEDEDEDEEEREDETEGEEAEKEDSEVEKVKAEREKREMRKREARKRERRKARKKRLRLKKKKQR